MTSEAEQLEEDTRQVESLQQSTADDLAVDPDIPQWAQDPDMVVESDEGAEG